jgi:hypothetical protein
LHTAKQVSVDIGVGWGKHNIRSNGVMPGLVMGERLVHRRRLALASMNSTPPGQREINGVAIVTGGLQLSWGLDSNSWITITPTGQALAIRPSTANSSSSIPGPCNWHFESSAAAFSNPPQTQDAPFSARYDPRIG